MTARARILDDVLAELQELRAPWALAHGRQGLDAVLSGNGDLDVVAGLPAAVLAHRLMRRWVTSDFFVVVLNQYDIGRGDAFWCVDRDGGGFLEVDVLCDPRGLGRLGVPTADVLASRSGGSIPAAAEEWRLAYQVSKRLWKRQWDRLPGLRSSRVQDTAHCALQQVFGRSAGTLAAELLNQPSAAGDWQRAAPVLRRGRRRQRWGRASAGPAELALLQMNRLSGRVRHPVGFWVHVWGPGAQETARAVDASIGVALVRHVVLEGRRARHWPQIAATLWRPGLAVTSSVSPPGHGLARPSLVLGPADHVRAQQRVADAMSARVTSRMNGVRSRAEELP